MKKKNYEKRDNINSADNNNNSVTNFSRSDNCFSSSEITEY